MAGHFGVTFTHLPPKPHLSNTPFHKAESPGLQSAKCLFLHSGCTLKRNQGFSLIVCPLSRFLALPTPEGSGLHVSSSVSSLSENLTLLMQYLSVNSQRRHLWLPTFMELRHWPFIPEGELWFHPLKAPNKIYSKPAQETLHYYLEGLVFHGLVQSPVDKKFPLKHHLLPNITDEFPLLFLLFFLMIIILG